MANKTRSLAEAPPEPSRDDLIAIFGSSNLPDDTTTPKNAPPEPTDADIKTIYDNLKIPEQSNDKQGLVGRLASSVGRGAATAGKYALGKIGDGFSYVDKRTLNPFLAANRSLQKTLNPVDAVKAAYDQYGEELKPDNSAQSIMEATGVPREIKDVPVQGPNFKMDTMNYEQPKHTDIPASKIAGDAYSTLEHPLNWLPGKKAAELVKSGVELATPATSKIVSLIGHTATGTPRKVYQTYIENRPEINSMIKNSGGDTQALVDDWRRRMIEDVGKAKDGFNAQIEAGIKAGEGTGTQTQPIIDALEAHKAKLDPVLEASDIDQINSFIDKLNQKGIEGIADAKNLYSMKKYLQKRARGSYKDGGQVFQVGPEAANAAKSAGGVAADIVHAISPEIEAGDEGIAGIRGAMKDIKGNTFVPGTAQGSALAAGSGNPTQIAALSKLDSIAGTHTLDEADKLAAAAHMSEPPILPTDTTGKAVARQTMGKAVAQSLPSALAKGAITGVTLGLTSPAAWKHGINAVGGALNLSQKILSSPKSKLAFAASSATNRALQKANSTPEASQKWGQFLSTAKDEDDFAKKAFVLKSTDPQFREHMKSQDEYQGQGDDEDAAIYGD